MIPAEIFPGLRIESAQASPQSLGFRPQDWPPSSDFPVVVDANGTVVSRYGDPSWNLAPWQGRPLRISFGDHEQGRGTSLSPENANLLRQVCAWWLFGPNAVTTGATLAMRHTGIKPVFAVCSEAGLLASDISRFPRVVEQVAARVSGSEANKVVARLHDLYAYRDAIGFQLLDEPSLRLLASLLPDHQSVQTAYIPPRIWTYQVQRLRECLDDYLAHREQIEACYAFCLKAYVTNAGSTARAFGKLRQIDKPFEPTIREGREIEGRRYYGRFRRTAERFGISELLDRWVVASDLAGVRALSRYLSLVSDAGLAYLLNFSLMRIDEGMQLVVGCHSVERDSLDDDVHLVGCAHTLRGQTSKTLQDESAHWIVSPSCVTAIEALTSIAKTRMSAGRINPRFKISADRLEKPFLRSRIYEPWASDLTTKLANRTKAGRYGSFVERYPKLFDVEMLRITDADLKLAQRMTFGLDPETFAVGRIWPLAWHQLRRTGACNMLSSGLVSESSLQYQLKHLGRATTRYYGQNHYRLKGRLDDETRGMYLREMYQSVAREFQLLEDDRYISPHGQKRKTQILNPISDKDQQALSRGAQAGTISYRPTFLGGCVKPGSACPLGGITNITGCMGYGKQKSCEWALLDRTKRPVIVELLKEFEDRLEDSQLGSPVRDSIEASIESAERALHAIDTF